MVVIPKRPASIVLNEAMVPDISDWPNTVSAYCIYSMWGVVKQVVLTSFFVLVLSLLELLTY